MNIHAALGDYQHAITNFDAATESLQSALRELQSKAGALPVDPFDADTKAAIATLTAAAGLKLSPGYADVVAAVKGR